VEREFDDDDGEAQGKVAVHRYSYGKIATSDLA
jgi:hypothetical protein